MNWNTLTPKRLMRAFSVAAAGVILIAPPTARGARVYFTDQPPGAAGVVVSVAPDGSDQRNLITVAGSPDLRGIVHHRGTDRLYVIDNGSAPAIFSIRTDGTDRQDIVSLNSAFLNADLEIDEKAARLYWAENGVSGTVNGFIKSSSLTGADIQTVVTTAGGATAAPYFMFLDPVGSYVYWGVLSSGSGPSSYRRAMLDGAIDPAFLITTTTRTRDIAIDAATRTAYWCDRQTGTLFRRGLNGGANQIVISGMNAPHGIALDVEAEKVYWADTGGRGSGPFNTSARRIARCNFDGTEYENISTPAADSEPWDLALDISSPTYAEWRTRFFSSTTSAAGPLDDADGDGGENLLEYALGTHPRKSASVPLLVNDGTGVKFTRRKASNVTYSVEVSEDLRVWHYNGDDTALVWTTERSVAPLGDDYETVVIDASAALIGAAKVFFRLRVEIP